MTPYEKEFSVTTVGSNQIVALSYPGRCTLDYITIILIGGGTVTADLFSRAFASPLVAVPVYLITNDGNGYCYVEMNPNSALACKVGDVVVVASSPTSGYNTSHRVLEVVDDFNIVTDQSWTADAVGGTAQVQIPSAEQELYRVFATITGASPLHANLDITFKNQDALPNRNIGVNRKLYVKLAATGTYCIAVRSHESIGTGA